MTQLPTAPDESLYERSLSLKDSPHPLQVSPAIFKSIVAATIDFLLERQLPATLWVKLPSGEAWQAELTRYINLARDGCQVYICNRQKGDGMDSSEQAMEPSPTGALHNQTAQTLSSKHRLDDDEQLIDDTGAVASAIAQRAPVFSVPIAANSELRREYFLLVISPQFSSLTLAHRPRSSRWPKGDPHHAAVSDPVTVSAMDSEPDRKYPLLVMNSFEPTVLASALQGIQQAVRHQDEQARMADEANPLVKTLLADWDARFQLPKTIDPALTSYLFSKYVQQQESTWRSAVTYRKQAEASESLQLVNEELRQSLRLKDELLGNVCQELRTPLSNMKTALTLLGSPQLKPAQRQRYLEVLSTECDRQNSILSGLMELVRLDRATEEPETHPVYLHDIVPGVVSTYQPIAQERGIMLAYTIPEELPPVSCLSAWLRQIAISLIDNGIHFTHPGGQVWVKAKPQGDYIQLEFRDSGIGIPASEIPKIFDRFHRVRHSHDDDPDGAGLGLTIVQQLLLRCGGSISVKSRMGEGSTFNVLLPIDRSWTSRDA